PRGVSFACASRPRHPYIDALATRGALVQLDLDDKQRFAVDEAAARAGGNLQHAVTLRQHLAGMERGQRGVEGFPLGLAGRLGRAWEGIAVDMQVVDGFGVLCAAREALPLDELGAVAGWTGEPQRRAFVHGARELLIETR